MPDSNTVGNPRRAKRGLSRAYLVFVATAVVFVLAYPMRNRAAFTENQEILKEQTDYETLEDDVLTDTPRTIDPNRIDSPTPSASHSKNSNDEDDDDSAVDDDDSAVDEDDNTDENDDDDSAVDDDDDADDHDDDEGIDVDSASNVKSPLTTADINPINQRPANVPNTTLPFKPKHIKYIESRLDRAGSVIFDWLKAHAFLFQRHDEFGGSCGENKWHAEVELLLETVGLQHVLQFACPPGITERTADVKDHFVSRAKYRHDEDHTFTPEWIEYMKQAMGIQTNRQEEQPTENVLKVAVHVRRGDVSLCTDNAKRRYSVNSHYIRQVERVIEQNPDRDVQVTIYSESPINYRASKGTQYESFDDFILRNYTMNLDGELAQVWRAFMDADILITSMSGFSMTPALLRLDRKGVIFTPHQNAYMLPHWQLVPEEDMQASAAEMREMQIEKCPMHGQEVDFFDDPEYDYERHYYMSDHSETL